MLKNWTRSMGSVLALALIFGAAAAAQTAAPVPKKAPAATAKKAPAAHEMVGTGVISSIDATHLTMTRTVAGKDEPMTLVLTPTTKKDGTLETGTKVTVRYHKENNDQVASSVRAQVATAKAKTPKAKAAAAKKS